MSEGPSSQFLRNLEAAMTTELRQQMGVALRVAVLLSLSFSQREIQARLSIDPTEYRRAKQLVDRAAERVRAGLKVPG